MSCSFGDILPLDKKRLQLLERIICQIHAITAYIIVYLVVVLVCHVQIQIDENKFFLCIYT